MSFRKHLAIQLIAVPYDETMNFSPNWNGVFFFVLFKDIADDETDRKFTGRILKQQEETTQHPSNLLHFLLDRQR